MAEPDTCPFNTIKIEKITLTAQRTTFLLATTRKYNSHIPPFSHTLVLLLSVMAESEV
jgi:hypothetical protein